MVTRALRFIALGLALGSIAACASRPPVDVALPRRQVAPGAPVARIGPVQDARLFEPYARDGTPMSLAPGVSDDAATRARVIGRRRSAAGVPQDNVFLREGRGVQVLVAEATRLGLERAGYRVLEPGDPGYPDDLAAAHFQCGVL